MHLNIFRPVKGLNFITCPVVVIASLIVPATSCCSCQRQHRQETVLKKQRGISQEDWKMVKSYLLTADTSVISPLVSEDRGIDLVMYISKPESELRYARV